MTELLHALFGWPVIVGAARLAARLVVLHQEPGHAEETGRSALSGAVHTLLATNILIDELYNAVIVAPLLWISTNVLWHVVDEGVIDGTVNGVARGLRESGGRLREIQSGNTRSYATWVVIGAAGVTVLMLVLWRMVL